MAGSVNSSRKTLEKLIEYDMNVVSVLGLDPDSAANVSGYQDLKAMSEAAGLEFHYFSKLNDPEIVSLVREKQPDFFFVIGLSQIVREELLAIPRYGCIGYHPTRLPKGRGRAAIAWIVLGEAEPAATFFLMDEGVDSGAILSQVAVETTGEEYAQDIIDKIMDAISLALDQVLPDMKRGTLTVAVQDEAEATYLGKRAPEDGLIDWSQPADDIHRLIRAVSRPLPGAFTFLQDKKLIIWRAERVTDPVYKGVPGRILTAEGARIMVQTGAGCLVLTDYEGVNPASLRVGKKLGIDLSKLLEKLVATV